MVGECTKQGLEALVSKQKNEIEVRAAEMDKLNELIRLKDNHIQNLENIINTQNAYIAAVQARDNRRRKIMKRCGVWYIGHGCKVLAHKLHIHKKNPITRLLATWGRCLRHPRRAASLYIKKKKLCFWRGDRLLDIAYLLYGPLETEASDTPVVSIIIPVYNQLEYTIHCIYSIMRNTKDVPYEVILADDVSSDGTKMISMYSDTLRVIRNTENTGFLQNCNHAAVAAKGKYLLFLNNDTQVNPEWLSQLVKLAEQDEKIGLCGSKLLYPNGTLQEAGGIIWKDGSGWNYGRNQDPERPEYNYVKDVDYISGASILVRRSVWDEIGGFDERFAPAYCEDSDFAFQVRAHGYRVVYQPLSEVVHFEGVSNGTDTSEGLKKYQVENTKKFREKWKDTFEKEQAKDPEELFLARDRSLFKKTILFIDHYVPQFDQDAGSKTVFAYVKMFVRLGYNVKFIGDNFYQHEPYTTILQQMGVEVLYGSWYMLHWKEWIKENGDYIDFVFMNRPHISIKYIDVLRKYTHAKLLYYGHDLHYLREMREYELTKRKEALEEAQIMKKMEYNVMDSADIVYYPSEIEIGVIKKENPSIHAKAIPAYIFDEVSREDMVPMRERKNLLFVGGFAHTPNVDAVIWFAKKIFPYIVKEIPDIRWDIIGSKATDEIKNLESPNIRVLGYVEEEVLQEAYRHCRIDVVPLRYGAGIKGKVVEAIYNHIPIVTTSVGAEGLDGCEQAVRIADKEKEFADAVIELYRDDKMLEEMLKGSDAYIEEHFSTEAVLRIIGEDIS